MRGVLPFGFPRSLADLGFAKGDVVESVNAGVEFGSNAESLRFELFTFSTPASSPVKALRKLAKA